MAYRERIDVSFIEHGDTGAGVVEEFDGATAAAGETDADRWRWPSGHDLGAEGEAAVGAAL